MIISGLDSFINLCKNVVYKNKSLFDKFNGEIDFSSLDNFKITKKFKDDFKDLIIGKGAALSGEKNILKLLKYISKGAKNSSFPKFKNTKNGLITEFRVANINGNAVRIPVYKNVFVGICYHQSDSQESTYFKECDLLAASLNEELIEARTQTAVKSNGIYSVMNKRWIKEPVKEDIPEVDQEALDKEFNKWKERYDNIISKINVEEHITEDASEKTLYRYEGPVYNKFRKLVSDSMPLYSYAVSKKQAVNNMIYQAAEKLGFDRKAGAQFYIDTSRVYIPDYDPGEDDEEITRELCPKCRKHYLNDAGECPLCDLGDDSVLDEAKSDLDISASIEEIENFIEDIYDLRKTSIANEGEYGIGNLVFKELRNLGCLDELKELKHALKSKQLSLESLDEHLNKNEIRRKVKDITEDDVKSWINPKDGWDMTIDPDTLKKADFEDLPDGWIVTQDFGLKNLFKETDYKGMTDFIKDILVRYGDKYYIGTYKMKYGKYRGMIAIDVNKVIFDTVEAIKEAVKNKQESIYRFDEYIYINHNLISRKTGNKRRYPFTKPELRGYKLDKHLVQDPDNDHLNIELVTGILPTDIPNSFDKKQ